MSPSDSASAFIRFSLNRIARRVHSFLILRQFNVWMLGSVH